mgnify:CR=1 FL=1
MEEYGVAHSLNLDSSLDSSGDADFDAMVELDASSHPQRSQHSQHSQHSDELDGSAATQRWRAESSSGPDNLSRIQRNIEELERKIAAATIVLSEAERRAMRRRAAKQKDQP